MIRTWVCVVAVLAGSVTAFAQSGVDLNTWVELTANSNGFWDVDNNGVEGSGPDGFFVRQEINGSPTIYASTDDFINTTIDGKFGVDSSGDNDFIGFVFGLQQPTTASNSTIDTLLFDWKQGSQSGAQPGFRLSYVTGDIINNGSVSNPYWTHSSTSDVTFQSLGTNTGSGLGWTDPTDYNFTLDYSTTNITIKIQGGIGTFQTEQTIFDIDIADANHIFTSEAFPTGKFGFYNFSQDPVRYEGFTRTDPALDTDPDDGETLAFLARVGDSDSEDLTVTNIGGTNTTLTGNAGAPGDPNFGGAGGAYSLNAGQSTGFTYTYTPGARTEGVAITDAINVSSNDANDVDGHDILFSAQGVGPVAQFTADGNTAIPGSETFDFGTIDNDDTATFTLTLENTTPDDNGGDSTLTDLSFLTAAITGADSDKFEILTATGTVIAKGGSLNIELLFDPNGVDGVFDDALLTIGTDQGAAFGATGASFTFNLVGESVPEPAGLALLAVGGGLMLGRGRRRTALG